MSPLYLLSQIELILETNPLKEKEARFLMKGYEFID